MNKKSIAIILGGTNPHIDLINNLKNRGYFTVLIDYYENPPAAKFADEHIRESTLDLDKILEITQNLNAKLVISTCIDQANVTACYVAEKMGLPAPYSYETALKVTNKGLMKELMLEIGVPTARHIFVKNISEFYEAGLMYPVVVKPADSNGSAGVRKVCSEDELLGFLSKALEISRTKQAIVEEFVDGIEVSVDCWVDNGKAHVALVRQKFEMNAGWGTVIQSPGSYAPANISQVAKQKLADIVKRIADALSLKTTTFLLQAFIKGDDVSIIEYAPRVGGGMSYRTIKLLTDLDFVDLTVSSYLGDAKEITVDSIDGYYSTNIIYAKPGVFDYLDGIDSLIKNGIVEEMHFYKTRGMVIGDDMSTRSRIGAFLIYANEKEELLKKLKVAVEQIEVYGVDGERLMRKDIYDGVQL